MKWAMVELFVDLTGGTALSSTDAVLAGIQRDADRDEKVKAALEKARSLGCGFVLMPGWTVVADRLPEWLLGLSAGITVVAECLQPAPESSPRARKAKAVAQLTKPVNEDTEDKSETEGPVWQSFVLHNGNVVIDPTRQYIAEASQLWDGEVLSSQGTELIQQLQVRAPAGRRWMIPGVGDTMLLLCGEANVVAGGGPSKCWNYESVEAAGLTEATLKTIRVVANPAHTRSGPQALRDKRAWLSRGGLLLHTANTYSGGWLQGVEEALGRASYTAARAWVKGKPSPLNEYPEDGFKVFTLNWEP